MNYKTADKMKMTYTNLDRDGSISSFIDDAANDLLTKYYSQSTQICGAIIYLQILFS